MLKLKVQYFDHLMRRTDSLEKTLILGKIEERRRRERQRRRWLDGITDSMDMSLSKLWRDGEGQGSLEYCNPWGHKESDTTERMNNMGQKPAAGLLQACLCMPCQRAQPLGTFVRVCTCPARIPCLRDCSIKQHIKATMVG